VQRAFVVCFVRRGCCCCWHLLGAFGVGGWAVDVGAATVLWTLEQRATFRYV
jgi:hypothetical protein